MVRRSPMCFVHRRQACSSSTCMSTVLLSSSSIRMVQLLGVGLIRFIWSQKMWCIGGPPSWLQSVTHAGSMRPFGFSDAAQHSAQYDRRCKEEVADNHQIVREDCAAIAARAPRSAYLAVHVTALSNRCTALVSATPDH